MEQERWGTWWHCRQSFYLWSEVNLPTSIIWIWIFGTFSEHLMGSRGIDLQAMPFPVQTVLHHYLDSQSNPAWSLASAQPCCSSYQGSLEESNASSISQNRYYRLNESWYLFAMPLLLSWLLHAWHSPRLGQQPCCLLDIINILIYNTSHLDVDVYFGSGTINIMVKIVVLYETYLRLPWNHPLAPKFWTTVCCSHDRSWQISHGNEHQYDQTEHLFPLATCWYSIDDISIDQFFLGDGYVIHQQYAQWGMCLWIFSLYGRTPRSLSVWQTSSASEGREGV